MGRPREFDEAEVVQKAMLVFWEKGYDAASLVDLEKGTGISRISIYNAFGDKEGLFLAALGFYQQMAEQRMAQMVVGQGIDGVERFFAQMAAPEDCESPVNNGCLMVNTALDVRQMGEVVQERVRAYREMLRATFARELGRSAETGEMGEDPRVEERAEYLVGGMWGALATIRMAGGVGAAGPMTAVMAETIRGWRAAV